MRYTLLLFLLVISVCATPPKVDLTDGTIIDLTDSLHQPTPYSNGAIPVTHKGIYQFNTEFTVPSELKTPALYYGSMYYPSRVRINDYEIYRWGNLEAGGGFTNYSAEKISIPQSILQDTNNLTIEFWTDGTVMGICKRWIGEDQDVTKEVELYNAINVAGIRVGVVISFFVFAISLIGYFLQNRQNRETLFFSLFALMTSITFHVFLFNSVAIDHTFQSKLFRTTTLLMSLTLFLFTSEMTKILTSKKIRIFFSTILIPVFVVVWLSDSKFEVEQVMSKAVPIYLAPLMLLSLGIILKALSQHKKSRSLWILLINFLIIFYGTYNDLSSLIQKKLPTMWMLPYAYIAITLTISLILLNIQLKLYRENQKNRTELERLNATLERTNSELETAKITVEQESAARESFIKTVAHELRTPLTGLLGGVDIVSTDPSLPRHLVKPMFFIKSSFHRLFVTVSNLFDFVEMRNDQISIVPCPFSVKDVIEPTLAFYKDDALSKGISLIALPFKNVPETLYGDSDHVIQILDNLIGNSVKFTEQGGVSCKITYEGELLKIDIRDTGCGIPQDKQDAMFKAFSRGEEFSFSQRYEGIGLGLAIVDATVKKMKGTITFESTQGQGTLFSVALPMLPVHKRREKFTSNKYVLIVEDNAVNSLMMRKQLEKGQFVCDTAFNGEEAVLKCRENRYDIVLMDIQMPIMDGNTATRLIRKFDKHIPIVSVTANATPSECLEAGANQVLMKPISAEKLQSVVTEQILARSSD